MKDIAKVPGVLFGVNLLTLFESYIFSQNRQ